ncbi:hypothetical protein CANCADRAFT_121669 [Tortispora caseinolytica NRRL Y-17796]|uniref:Peptidase S8/S53 domain-containing protein n=1 Tax=Tortispora caseinolytica NRRL Y-17796 TaxID=767744 RepID=A0A1E4THQ1_9ASCO|nr:hypothetical protein CANCADRAFT_121669 [Tortispora caseinolytica NRRL Y-17796]
MSNANTILQLTSGTCVSEYLRLRPYLENSVIHTFSFGGFEGLALKGSPNTLQILESDSLIADAQEDTIIHAFGVIKIQEQPPKHLSFLSQTPHYAYDHSSGSGVYAYVLDTGVNKKHREFEGRVIEGKDLTGEGFEDQHGHGTHVAGLISSKTFGVCKNSIIVNVKTLKKDGSGSLSDVIAGIDFAANHRIEMKRPGVANLSLGGARSSIMNAAIDAAVLSGLAVVVAAGNSNIPASAMSPASSRNVVVVGAIDYTNRIASFSNWGRAVTVFAPGVDVCSVNANTDSPAPSCMSGTSMASPQVAGLLAYFMGMGDDPATAVERLISTSRSAIPLLSVLVRPFTYNRLAYNNAGLPFQSSNE